MVQYVDKALSQLADFNILPAAFCARGPVLAAVDLDGDAPFGTEGCEDCFLVVVAMGAFVVGSNNCQCA